MIMVSVGGRRIEPKRQRKRLRIASVFRKRWLPSQSEALSILLVHVHHRVHLLRNHHHRHRGRQIRFLHGHRSCLHVQGVHHVLGVLHGRDLQNRESLHGVLRDRRQQAS